MGKSAAFIARMAIAGFVSGVPLGLSLALSASDVYHMVLEAGGPGWAAGLARAAAMLAPLSQPFNSAFTAALAGIAGLVASNMLGWSGGAALAVGSTIYIAIITFSTAILYTFTGSIYITVGSASSLVVFIVAVLWLHMKGWPDEGEPSKY